MRIKFRSTFLGILLTFIAASVGLVAIVSYFNARFTADDLSRQLLEQTSARVDGQVQRLVAQAVDQGTLTRRLLAAGRLRPTDFPGLIAFWLEELRINPGLTSLFIGIEATGESTGVSRLQGKLSIWQSARDPRTGLYQQRDFWPEDYPTKPYAYDPDKPTPDTRSRPWYRAARETRRPVWTETYPFLGVAGATPTQGVTYATQIYEGDTLLGVLIADFDLKSITAFLRTLRLGNSGYAFVVERRKDGTDRIIAHPTSEGSDARAVALMSAHGDTFEVEGKRWIGAFRPLSGDHPPPWSIGMIIPEEDVLGRVDRSNHMSLLITIASFALAMFLGARVARQVARPLESLSKEMGAISELRLEPRPIAHSFVLEVDRVAVASEEMKTGLRSFQKYVPQDLVRLLMASHREAALGGERRRVTTFFSDIVGFTGISERMAPEAVVEHLREYLGALNGAILAGKGTVDKFIGDSIMAFWGAPAVNPRHALEACRAALTCQRELVRLNANWASAGKPEMHTRMGVNTGEVVVGNVGSDTRMNYTVIGDAVNLASRLEALNKYYGTKILLGEETRAEAAEALVLRPIDWVSVKGRAQPVAIYELLGLSGEVDPAVLELSARHGDALTRYRAQRWDEAIAGFDAVLRLQPADVPARLMRQRCEEYRAHPPGDGWDGVQHMATK
ncbi:MAG: hypothetical protein HYZ53_30550 [Planctomycetes bacterium]|nr:hypothetical protein [Planctomycetota bacterium]